MRGTAPIEVTVTSSAGWQAGVAALCGVGVGGIGVWALATVEQHGIVGVAIAVAASGLIALIALRPLMAAPLTLRWDGVAWQLREARAAGDGGGAVGDVKVAIDLGHWMLLQFVTGAGWRRRVAWLSLQRSAHTLQWHALRCAVFAPGRASPSP